jgi:hypothetical protein
MDMQSERNHDDESKSSWLNDTLRQFNFVAQMRERNLIRRTCAECMRIYHTVAEAMPQATRIELYTRIVQTRSGAGPDEVRTILRSAEPSYAQWPVDRDLIFRDVVNYFAVTDCLKADPSATGVRADVLDIVSHEVPADL